MLAWLGVIRAVMALAQTMAQLLRDRSIREDGRRGAFLDLYRENYERLRKANEIRAKDKPSSDDDIANRL